MGSAAYRWALNVDWPLKGARWWLMSLKSFGQMDSGLPDGAESPRIGAGCGAEVAVRNAPAPGTGHIKRPGFPLEAYEKALAALGT